MYYTYILKCFDNSYYVGSTGNLKNRINDHNLGKGAEYTARRKPCCLVWYKKHLNSKQAILQEKQIKRFSRNKKEDLIFTPKLIWKHYKGNKYIILGSIDDFIVYSELGEWKDYLVKKNIQGNQCQVWLRNKNHWLDWIDKEKKILRFNLVSAE